jgi:hypothetical protein
MLSEPILVVAQLVHAFDALGVEYVVGGSLASSVYGIPRASQYVDLVAKMNAGHAEPVALRVEDHVDIDVEVAIEQARQGFCVGSVHLGDQIHVLRRARIAALAQNKTVRNLLMELVEEHLTELERKGLLAKEK